jgi:hypothetical protein
VALKSDKTGNQLEQVRTALRTAGKGALHSALYHWMRQNHDRLIALFEDSAPAWAILADTFGRMGLTDREGKSPAPKTVRMTWYRVRLDVTRLRARRIGQSTSDPTPAVTFVSGTVAPAFSRTSDSFVSEVEMREERSPPESEDGAAIPTASPRPLLFPGGSPAGDPDPRPRTFGLARPRGHVPSTPPSPPPVPVPEPIRRTPEEVARIMAEMMSGAPKNPFRRDKGD